MCVLISLQLSSETFLILRRNEQDLIKNVYWPLCKYPLFLSDFNETWNFFDRFSKNHQKSNFIKIRPVGVELFYADGRTDMKKFVQPLLQWKRNKYYATWVCVYL